METISEAIRHCRDDGARSAMMMIAENQTQIPRYTNVCATEITLRQNPNLGVCVSSGTASGRVELV